jgi:hypothetical protein
MLKDVLSADHFYVFKKRDLKTGAAAKHKFTKEEFTPDLNAVSGVLKPDAADGVVELASDRSGVRLVFGSNRMSLSHLCSTNSGFLLTFTFRVWCTVLLEQLC